MCQASNRADTTIRHQHGRNLTPVQCTEHRHHPCPSSNPLFRSSLAEVRKRAGFLWATTLETALRISSG
jgi:hypothetical protein